ncbi:4Fe-4S binding protein, partial [Phascolarctobacterium faecium]
EYCVSCGTCTKACPLQAISVPDGISAVVELARCIGCGLCARECPASVIKVVTADV